MIQLLKTLTLFLLTAMSIVPSGLLLNPLHHIYNVLSLFDYACVALIDVNGSMLSSNIWTAMLDMVHLLIQ